MNKRQAKIEALWLAVGALDGIEAISPDLPPKDQEKVEEAFLAITRRLAERASRLEDSK